MLTAESKIRVLRNLKDSLQCILSITKLLTAHNTLKISYGFSVIGNLDKFILHINKRDSIRVMKTRGR